MAKILIIGAHPDDDEISAGLTALIALKEGHDVISVSMTQGSARNKQERLAEWELASARMGYTKNVIYDFPDTMLPQCHTDLIDKMRDLAHEYSPDHVYFHSNKDTHQDHKAVHDAASVAFRNGPSLYEMMAPSLQMSDFRPHIFYETTDILLPLRKAYALSAYKSQADIVSPQAGFMQMVTYGRWYRTKQHVRTIAESIDDDKLLHEIVSMNPFEIEPRNNDLHEVYKGIMALCPLGTIYAECFEPNHVVPRW
ncbi:MAG: PIG-L family deacetylase [Candidatus Woesearchaeota archaeon]|nr:PIG-L family deacetylase [Candidatus Woesearchaeota archaeon]